MSYTSRKGHEGEAGTRDFLNQWFPHYDTAGIGVDISPSKGANDEGDLVGVPWTCIECKNHSNPKLGPILDNAEWKSRNSGRPIWFLVYKRARYGLSRAGYWHTCTTVDGFLSGYMPVTDMDSSTPLKSFEVSDVEDLCFGSTDLKANIGVQLPGIVRPKFQWSLNIMFRPYMMNIEDNRNEDIDAHGMDDNERVVPIVIHPRRDRPPGDWYVYTRLAGQARMLETVGVLPQDESDYLSHESEAEHETV